jgi:hypothetical protein
VYYRSVSIASTWLAALALATFACAGPRTFMVTHDAQAPLEPDDRVDVYVGTLDPPCVAIAQIDSSAYPYVTDAIKDRQLEELRRKARALGANALDQARVLTMQVRGMTAEENASISVWKQERYQLYFMRARALRRVPDEPSSLEEARPKRGWQVERMATPRRLDAGQLAQLDAFHDDRATTHAATLDATTSWTTMRVAKTATTTTIKSAKSTVVKAR